MYTFEDIKRIFISESGIEQILRRTRIVIPQSNTFGYRSTRKLLLIIATGFHCWKRLKGMTTVLSFKTRESKIVSLSPVSFFEHKL